jgi:hypothetical protein
MTSTTQPATQSSLSGSPVVPDSVLPESSDVSVPGVVVDGSESVVVVDVEVVASIVVDALGSAGVVLPELELVEALPVSPVDPWFAGASSPRASGSAAQPSTTRVAAASQRTPSHARLAPAVRRMTPW